MEDVEMTSGVLSMSEDLAWITAVVTRVVP
jgi:hypothetical protein